jgi:putative membrane protein
MLSLLPHFGALCNLVITALIIWAFIAIRRGDRELHPKLMKAAIGLGAVFLVSYLIQVGTIGHAKAPGEGTYRSVFLGILMTHTICAVLMLPLILRSAYLGIKGRFVEHKKIVRFAYPVWLYVGLSGVAVYLMIYQLPS